MIPLMPILFALLVFFHGCVATEWVVYPKSHSDVAKCAHTRRLLTLLVGRDNVRTIGSTIRKTTEFWLVQASDAQKGQMVSLTLVEAVYANSVAVIDCGRTYGNATAVANETEPETATPRAPFVWQSDAPADLNLISWPPKRELPKKYRGYIYDVEAGIDTYVYVIDNGIRIQNPDFTKKPWPPTSAEWHYAPGVRRTETDDSDFGHGSCVASKAAGWRNGVSKNSRLVIMKASLTIADQHWAFAAALDDILQKGRQKKAVIVYSRISIQPANDVYREGPYFMWTAIQNLIYELSHDAGILVVVAAGNFVNRSKRIDTFPGIWANFKPTSKGPGLIARDTKPLLAVGAVTLTGSKAPFSQGLQEFQLRWAPGAEVNCASGDPYSPEQVHGDGTSFAAAMVAGFAAYTMNQRVWSDPMDLESMLRARPIYTIDWNTNPPVIWNGLNGAAKVLQNVSISQSTSGGSPALLNLTASG